MRNSNQWATWNSPLLAPLQLNGEPASPTDPGTWTSYAQIRSQPRKGFMLGKMIGCITVNFCVVDGELTPRTKDLLATFANTYIELAPAGDGANIFGWLPELPPERCPMVGIDAEVHGRDWFVPITGDPFGGKSQLAHLRPGLSKLRVKPSPAQAEAMGAGLIRLDQ